MMQAIRQALEIKGRLFWLQWVGNFLLMLLAAGWLQIPDSHSWQFVFSILSGVLLVVGFLWLYIATFRHLLPCAPRPPWWLSCLLLAVFIALWWLLLQPIAALRAHEALYAGYWNSQSPPWLRHHLGYSSLVAWQEHIYDCIQCIVAGLLLPLAMETSACGVNQIKRANTGIPALALLAERPGLRPRSSRPSPGHLADWTPDAGLVGQTFSIVARLGFAYTVDILLWCFLLSLIAHYEKPQI